jgi:hypothetical protein
LSSNNEKQSEIDFAQRVSINQLKLRHIGLIALAREAASEFAHPNGFVKLLSYGPILAELAPG